MLASTPERWSRPPVESHVLESIDFPVPPAIDNHIPAVFGLQPPIEQFRNCRARVAVPHPGHRQQEYARRLQKPRRVHERLGHRRLHMLEYLRRDQEIEFPERRWITTYIEPRL